MQIGTDRNIAIVAHVDHGKTIVDGLFGQSSFRNIKKLKSAYDPMTQRERGITIRHNTPFSFDQLLINP